MINWPYPGQGSGCLSLEDPGTGDDGQQVVEVTVNLFHAEACPDQVALSPVGSFQQPLPDPEVSGLTSPANQPFTATGLPLRA